VDLLLPTNFKRTLMYILVDIFFTFLASYIAFLLRFDFSIPQEYYFDIVKAFIFLSCIRVTIFYYFDLYKVSWRHFGFRDNARFVYLLFLSTLIFLLFLHIFRATLFLGFPRSVVPIEFFVSLFLFSAFRGSRRFYLEIFNKNPFGIPTLIVANLQEAEEITRNLIKNQSKYRPVVVLNEKAKGTKVNGINILGFDKIKKIYDGLEVAIISSDFDVKEIYNKLNRLNIKQYKKYLKIDNQVDIKDISIEDLLARKPKDLDNITIANFIAGKTVLITGAGGSIGSELSRQVVAFGARQIILLDHSEFNLYQITEELKDANIVSVMLSVQNREALDKLFMQYLPDVVIHAAAYKHVPLCEENIDSAIENNVFGTKNVIDLSVKYEVEKFVLVSTDKAVRPTNVMGTTKRICELYAHAIPSNKTEIVAVRFGNVLGSSGSVIPKFKSQIEKGEDLTVTHPEITRYFMMIPEACQLVLQAASIAKGGELFILDMGEPIKIVDLAKKMIELSGRDDIKIKFTGLRAGEKLYEELLIDEADLKTEYDSILVSQNPPVDYEWLLSKLEELKTRNRLEVLKEIVPEFNHKV